MQATPMLAPATLKKIEMDKKIKACYAKALRQGVVMLFDVH